MGHFHLLPLKIRYSRANHTQSFQKKGKHKEGIQGKRRRDASPRAEAPRGQARGAGPVISGDSGLDVNNTTVHGPCRTLTWKPPPLQAARRAAGLETAGHTRPSGREAGSGACPSVRAGAGLFVTISGGPVSSPLGRLCLHAPLSCSRPREAPALGDTGRP